MRRIGLLSDTHGFLDEALFKYFSECDEIWHAGDFGPAEVLDRLKSFKEVRGVFGNIDGAEIRAELPEQMQWTCEELSVYMRHIGGYPGNYDPRAKREIARVKPDLFICGHSHIARVMRDPACNLLHMNPGAAGYIGWHTKRTAMRFQINGRKVENVELIELEPRHRNETRPA